MGRDTGARATQLKLDTYRSIESILPDNYLKSMRNGLAGFER